MRASDQLNDGGLAPRGNERHSNGPERYTGVIVVQGRGTEKRGETLTEVLDALSSWLHQYAGFAVRPEGRGRIWVRTALTTGTELGAPVSRATLDIAAPSSGSSSSPSQHSEDTLRLELREVWWGQRFDVPPLGTSLGWASVQFREVLLRLLLPRTLRVGRAREAEAAHYVAQALSFRPRTGSQSQVGLAAESGGVTSPLSPPQRTAIDDRLQHAMLLAALWLYDLLQYVWKAIQWLVLLPIVWLLLILLGILRFLAFVPFIGSAVLTVLSTLFGYLSLDWMAPMYAYVGNYTRSATMRQTFEQQITDLLQDEQCDRVVVLAQAVGAALAYDGLTTTLAQPQLRESQKPITLISMGQALRRMWLVDEGDSHQERQALPPQVRWVNFWARYDPLAAGPLGMRSIPANSVWQDRDMPDPIGHMQAALAACENVDVANTDNFYSDPRTYWANAAQVVGPIALESVRGHPALERAVSSRLATHHAVLQRHWDVAWRSIVALSAGIAVAFAFLQLDLQNDHVLGRTLGEGIPGLLAFLVNQLTGRDPAAIGQAISSSSLPDQVKEPITQLGTLVTTAQANLVNLYSGLAVVVGLALGLQVVGRFVAMPSSFDRGARRTLSRRTWTPFALSTLAVSLVVVVVVLLLITPEDQESTAYQVIAAASLSTLALLGLTLVIAWVVTLLAARQRSQWAWFLVTLVAPAVTLVLFFRPSNTSAGAAYDGIAFEGIIVAAVGACVILIDALRARRWVAFVGLLILLPVLVLSIVVAPLAAIILYGLWAGPATLRTSASAGEEPRNQMVSLLSALSLIILLAAYIDISLEVSSQSNQKSGLVALLAVGGLLAVGALVLVAVDAVRGRRWLWIAALLLTLSIAWTAGFSLGAFVELDVSTLTLYALWQGILATTLAYILWAGPSKVRPGKPGLAISTAPAEREESA
jgi:hypothetical protein